MATILRRPQFLTDVYEIWSYIARDSLLSADKIVYDLEQHYQVLAKSPLIGVKRLPNYPKFRIFPFGKYVIVYSPLDNGSGIELIRLIHSARDYHHFFR
jgi:toxin ParE1/3/4